MSGWKTPNDMAENALIDAHNAYRKLVPFRQAEGKACGPLQGKDSLSSVFLAERVVAAALGRAVATSINNKPLTGREQQ
jgi:hypothetical protein